MSQRRPAKLLICKEKNFALLRRFYGEVDVAEKFSRFGPAHNPESR